LNHHIVCGQISFFLRIWNKEYRLGRANIAPGIIFDSENCVAPDVIWISNERLTETYQADGKLHSAPELVVEVLSPGSANEARDRSVKLKLYSRRGVSEYWLVSWPKRQLEVYRRNPELLALELIQTLFETDTLTSPLLPGFSCKVSEIFEKVI